MKVSSYGVGSGEKRQRLVLVMTYRSQTVALASERAQASISLL